VVRERLLAIKGIGPGDGGQLVLLRGPASQLVVMRTPNGFSTARLVQGRPGEGGRKQPRGYIRSGFCEGALTEGENR